ncbi:biopolymer transporter ExbB, partial [Klebsiella pneumoniae]
MRNRIMPGVYIVIIPYVIVSICYLLFRHYIPGVSFSAHRDGLGATLSSYGGT